LIRARANRSAYLAAMPIAAASPEADARRARAPATAIDVALGLALAALAWKLYRETAPAIVNLDGLGYVKLLPHNFAAGHLLYMPLLRATTARFGGDGLAAGRALSSACGGLSVGLMFLCARSLLGRAPATLSAVGLAVSYVTWAESADVEVYALALALLLAVFALALAYRLRPTAGAAAAVGVALGAAVLSHLTHALATPFVVAWMALHARRRVVGFAHALFACSLGAAIALAGYAWAAFAVRGLRPGGALRWIATAGHGFRYQGGPLGRLADSTYGLAKAFVWSPYLYESNAQRLLGQFLLGLAAAALLVGVTVARRRSLPPLPRAPLWVWIASYAAVALLFFGSDPERWLFVLPPLWLLGAAAVDTLRRRALAVAAAAVALLLTANAVSAVGPAMHETWDRTRADAAAAVMADDDLVVFPGHSWDEYIGFYTGRPLRPLPLAYYAGLLGPSGCLARVEREVAEARARGARVWAVRLDDLEDTRGWFELASLGLSRDELGRFLTRFHLAPVPTVEPKVTVWRLDPTNETSPDASRNLSNVR
jgi:hypothetical protein